MMTTGTGEHDSGQVLVEKSAEPQTLLGRFAKPSLDGVVLAVALVLCVRIGMQPLQDSSFLTHLATGRLILDEGSVPSTDPYSWSAPGSPWLVQSWLASVVYASIEEIAGLGGIRLLATGLAMALTVMLWKLTEVSLGLVGRAVAMGLVLLVGFELWVERPLMFGAVGLAAVMLAADGRFDARWLVPIVWLWANAHGSFLFAPALLLLYCVGRAIDERRRPEVELRCLLWSVVGASAAAVGPLGTKVLTFSLTVLENRQAFAEVREWQPIDFGQVESKVFAVQVLLAAIALVRIRRWRSALPVVVFTVAAFGSARNVLPASIILTPVVAAGLGEVGRVVGSRRPSFAAPVLHALCVVGVVSAAMLYSSSHTALRPYPQDALAWMSENDLLEPSSQMLTRDVVGNYVEFAYGPEQVKVYMDDRVDMFPMPVLDSYIALLKQDRDHEAALEEIDPTSILWDRNSKLGRWLAGSEQWDVVWEDETWLVAVPVGSGP